MNSGLLIALVVLVVVLAAAVAWLLVERRRTTGLKEHYGREYERTVGEFGNRRRAERELERRQERMKHLDIRPLPAEERLRFAGEWHNCQTKFVDDPAGAVGLADRLVMDVMTRRGYPVADFEQRAADISVDHPRVVDNYRAAHEIAIRHERGSGDTEDLRKAMVHYRSLFEDLLETPVSGKDQAA